MAKKKDGSSSLVSGSADDASVLRRSGRETPSSSKKQATSSSPLNIRKSERIEKQTSPSPSSSPVKKKPERIEKQMGPSPLRRSDRGKKLAEVPDLPNIKSKKAITSKQSTGDVNNEDDMKNQTKDPPDVGVAKRKRFTAIRYKAIFKPQRIRIESGDDDEDPKGQDMSLEANASSNEDVVKELKSQTTLIVEEAPGLQEKMMDLDQTEHDDCPKVTPLDDKSIESGIMEKQIGGNLSQSNRNIADSDYHTSLPRISHDLENQQQEIESCHKVTGTCKVMENAAENNIQSSGSILNSSKFVEFWVPVEISNVQLEQYCRTLLQCMALRSCSKSDSLGALNDILTDNRKCCNHPYIVDPELQQLFMKDVVPTMYLDVGIKASGKLQLLDLILPELKKRELRVLILFQPTIGALRTKGYCTLGDILVDYVSQRFGQDSYEHVDGLGNMSSKKQAAISIFNKEMSRFIFLLESRACHPGIKLSSIDVIIIFDSDVNPGNDLRVLQKIHIDSQSEQIRIFRLYSSSTLEEKILKLAEQNVTIDIRSQNLRSNYDALLTWGASDLFDKLTHFHNQSVVSYSSAESFSFLKDVVEEFVCIISHKSKTVDTSKSIIKRLQNHGKNITLHSEIKTYLQDGDLPHIFWRKLLEGRCPSWKFVSESTPRQRKRPNYFLDSSEGTNVDGGGAKTRRKTTVYNNNNTTIEPAHLKSITEQGKTGGVNNEGGSGVPAHNESPSLSDDQFWSTEVANEASLYDLLKPTVSELCNVLNFSEDVKLIVGRFLEFVLENYNVPNSKEHTNALQAFMISLCWIGSSVAKVKIDRSESFAVAKKHFSFSCMEEQTNSVYQLLEPAKEIFLQHTQIPDALKDCIPPAPQPQGVDSVNLETEKCQHAQSESSNEKEEEEANRCKKQSVDDLSTKEEQQKELDKFNREWDKKWVDLENDYHMDKAVICMLHRSNPSIRSEKIKVLDKEFANKLEQHKRSREIDHEDLKAKLLLLAADDEPPLHGSQHEHLIEAQGDGGGNDIESTGSHSSGKQVTNALVSSSDPSPADDMEEEDDVAGKVDSVVDGSKQERGASSPDRSNAVEEDCYEIIGNDMVVSHVGSGEMGTPAGDCNRDNAQESTVCPPDTSSSSHVEEAVPGDVAAAPHAEMGMLAGNCIKENAEDSTTTSPPDTSHAAGEKDHNETGPNGVDPADMGVRGGNCDDEISLDASHATAAAGGGGGEEDGHKDSCGGSNPQSAAVSQDNMASVLPVASVPIIPELQNESLELERLPDSEIQGQANPPNSLAEVDNLQQSDEGSQPGQIITEDSLLDPRDDDEEPTLLSVPPSDGNLEQHILVVDGDCESPPPTLVEHHPSSGALNMFDNQVGSWIPSNQTDPLQAEVERLYQVKDNVTKYHEETKQRLTYECEKEIADMIAQINRKYEAKQQEAEAAYQGKKKELEMNINRVIMNRILAEAFRSKCQDLTPPNSRGTQQVSQAGLMQQLHRFAGQPLTRHSQSTASSSGSSQLTPRPPLQIVHQPAALFSSRPPPPHSNLRPPIPAPPSNTNLAIPNNSMPTEQFSNITPSTSRPPPPTVNLVNTPSTTPTVNHISTPSNTPSTSRPPPPPLINQISPSTSPSTSRPPSGITSSNMPNRPPPSINAIDMSAANLRINTETRGQSSHLRPLGEIRSPAPHLRPLVSSDIRSPAPHLRPMAISEIRAPAPHLRPTASSDIRAPAPHIRSFRSTSDFAAHRRTPPPASQHVTSSLPLTSTSYSQSPLPSEPYTVTSPPPPPSALAWQPSRSSSPQQQQQPSSGMPDTSFPLAHSSSHAQLPRVQSTPLTSRGPSPDNPMMENSARWNNNLTPPSELVSQIELLDITDFIQEGNGNAHSSSAHDLVLLSDDDD